MFEGNYPKTMSIIREAHRRFSDDASIRAYIEEEFISGVVELVDEFRQMAMQYGIHNHRTITTRLAKNRAEAQHSANSEVAAAARAALKEEGFWSEMWINGKRFADTTFAELPAHIEKLRSQAHGLRQRAMFCEWLQTQGSGDTLIPIRVSEARGIKAWANLCQETALARAAGDDADGDDAD